MAIRIPILWRNDDSGLKDAQASVSNFSVIAGGAMARIGSMATEALAQAAKAVVDFGVDSIKAAAESEAVARGLEQIAKNSSAFSATTADIKGATDALMTHSTEMSKLTGIDDEVLNSMKTTWLAIPELAGRGAEGINNLAVVAADVAAGTGKSIETIGQAFIKVTGDEETALSKLQRAGIVLSDEQKTTYNQILATNGEIAAQDYLIKTLGSTYEGAAAAAANPFERVKAIIEDLQEQIGIAFLPALETMIPKIQEFVDNLTTSPEFATFIDTLAGSFQTMFDLLVEMFPIFSELAPVVGGALLDIFKIVGDLMSDLTPLIKKVAPISGKIIKSVLPIVGKILELISPIIDLLSPILDVAFALVDVVLKVLSPVIDILVAILKPIIEGLSFFLDIILWPIKTMFELLGTAFDAMGKIWQAVYDAFIKPVWDAIWGLISPIYDWLKTNVFDALGAAFDVLGRWWDSVYWTYIEPVWTKLKEKFAEVKEYWVNEIQPKLQEVAEKIWPKIVEMKDKIVEAFQKLEEKLGPIMEKIGPMIGMAFKIGANMAIAAINGVMLAISAISYAIKGFRDGTDLVYSALNNGKHLPSVSAIPYSPIAFLAEGGTVAKAGLSWVGENGPELLNLPSGAQVTPLDKVSGGGSTYNINISTLKADATIGEVIVNSIKKYERTSGAVFASA